MPLQGNATFDLPKACDYLPDAFTADPKLIAQALERPSSGKAIDNHLVPDLVCHPLSSPLLCLFSPLQSSYVKYSLVKT